MIPKVDYFFTQNEKKLFFMHILHILHQMFFSIFFSVSLFKEKKKNYNDFSEKQIDPWVCFELPVFIEEIIFIT